MLKETLQAIYPNLMFTITYFGYTDAAVQITVASEILRVWGNEALITCSRLSEMLAYIPIERIKNALAQNNDFIWNSFETYTHISRVHISDDMRKLFVSCAERECRRHGYVSITDLPTDGVAEMNDELSVVAIQNAMYRLCLASEFDKNGKIITRKGDAFNAMTIMTEHCRSIDRCSLDELLDFERDLTGESHRWVPMEAGYAILVRINKDTFVSEKHVHFDVAAIDETIELFVKGRYLPLKAFSIFSAFPDCGQPWNLFLLESYCRRFSLSFRFDTPSVNSKNAGAVVRKNCDWDYVKIMADAVATAGISLQERTVCSFLYDSGYIGKRTTSKIKEIIDLAKEA